MRLLFTSGRENVRFNDGFVWYKIMICAEEF